MVSKASEDLPEPESPVITTSWSRGISRSMFLRLCSRAPRMTIRSLAMATYCVSVARPRQHSVLDWPPVTEGLASPVARSRLARPRSLKGSPRPSHGLGSHYHPCEGRRGQRGVCPRDGGPRRKARAEHGEGG